VSCIGIVFHSCLAIVTRAICSDSAIRSSAFHFVHMGNPIRRTRKARSRKAKLSHPAYKRYNADAVEPQF